MMMLRGRLQAPLCVALWLGLSGCLGAAPTMVPPQVSNAPTKKRPTARVSFPGSNVQTPSVELPPPQRFLEKAKQLSSQGHREAQRQVLAQAVRQGHPTEARAAALTLAEEAVEESDWDQAKRWLSGVEFANAPQELRRQVHRLKALTHEGLGDYAVAADTWLLLAAGPTPLASPQEAIEGAVRTRFLAGEPGQAEQSLRELVGAEDVSEQLVALVRPHLRGELLANLYAKVAPEDPWAAWLAFEFARRVCEQGELERCRSVLTDAMQGSLDPRTRVEAEHLVRELEAWDRVAPDKIGLLLPLSGRYQRVGQAALESIQLALKSVPGVRLVVRDSQGLADEAARQTRALILEEHVVAGLGPIGKLESEAAAEVSRRYRVPQMVLASADEIGGADGILRFRLSRREQAIALAAYAVKELKLTRAGILFPDHDSGRRSMTAFWREFERLGGEVRAVESYPPDGRDFDAVIGRLVGTKRRGKGAYEFDLLFLPGDALTIRRLVPFLHSWSIRLRVSPSLSPRGDRPAVQLLGTAGWNNHAVIDRGEYLTNNAVFVAPWFHETAQAPNDDFAQSFKGRYRHRAHAFHAEVHDAAAWLFGAVSEAGVGDHKSRKALWQRIQESKRFEGATGRAEIDEQRVLRQPWILTIDREQIRPRFSENEERVRREGATNEERR